MKLVICSEYFHPSVGSTGKVLYELSGELLRLDPDLSIDVICGSRSYRSHDDGSSKALGDSNLSVEILPTLSLDRGSPPKRFLGDVWFATLVFFRLLFQSKPDAVLVVTNPFILPMAIRLFGFFRKVPYLYLIHDLYPDIAISVGTTKEEGFIAKSLRRLQARSLSSAYRVIVLGRCMRELLMENYHVPAAKIEILTNWANPQAILPMRDETTRNTLRRGFGLGEFVCLYSGNLGLFHDFDTLLDAAGILLHEDSRIQFLIAGDGAAKDYILARIESEGLTNVRFTGLVPLEELPKLLAAADVAVVSLLEGVEGQAVPLKFYNLLAAGKPIITITSPFSEIARVVTEAQCGFQVEQGDHTRLASELKKLASDPERLAQMSAKAREVLEERYTLSRVARGYHEILQNLKNGV